MPEAQDYAPRLLMLQSGWADPNLVGRCEFSLVGTKAVKAGALPRETDAITSSQQTYLHEWKGCESVS